MGGIAYNQVQPQKIELIWIDANVNNNENKSYVEQIKSFMSVNLSCFEKISEAINYIKKIEFNQTYIICSGRFYPDFIIEFKSIINDLMICPKIIIFCGNANSYLKRNKDNDILSINHPFYNSGGVKDAFEEVKDFLLQKNPKNIETMSFEIIHTDEDKFNFEFISNKEQLILPVFFTIYIKKPVEKEIEKFNEHCLQFYSDRFELNEIFTQLSYFKEIPNEILSKFWIRAYSSEGNLSKDINEELKSNKIEKYLPFIEAMYEGFKNDISLEISSDISLYRYTTLSKDKIDNMNIILSKKKPELPAIIMYAKYFINFYTNKKEASKNNDISSNNVLLIIKNAKENLIYINGYKTMDKYTFYKKDQILFFPFLFFEIIKIEKLKSNNYNIYLECLGKYANLFKGEDPKNLVEKIPENSSLTKDIFNIKIIDDSFKDIFSIVKIKYHIDPTEKKVRIFGEKFVENNKDKCYMIYKGQKSEITEYFLTKNLKEKTEELEIKLTGLNNVTDISHIFDLCFTLKSLPNFSKINTDKITNMSGMFKGCSNLEILPDISKWNTSNVVDMSYLFSKCSSLKKFPDISKWNTSNVTNMSYMFDSCTNIEFFPDISKWAFRNVTNVSFMFYNLPKLEYLPDISKWDTSKVTDMSSLFERCSTLKSLPDISIWNTDNVIDVSYIFYNCKSLESLPHISNWNNKNIKKMEYMFYGLEESINIPEKFKTIK